MAKIAEYLKQILSARYGRDVRQSIHDAISAINDESTECWATVEKVPETLAIAAVKDRVSGKDVTLPLSSDFVATDFKAKGNTEQGATSGKNLLDYSGLTTQTIGGITYTPVYDDKGLLQYVNANGEATVISSYDVKRYISANGQCILNGCPSGGSETTYRMDCYYSGTSNNDIGEGVTFEAIEGQLLTTRIVIWKGVKVSNLKFYPMIRLATITDGTYEPFTNGASPNPQYEQPLRKPILSEIKTCRKNLFKCTSFSNGTQNGVTLEGYLNEQGFLEYFTLNGTCTNAIYRSLTFPTMTLPKGSYVLNGCPSGGGTSTYRWYISTTDGKTYIDNGSGVSFTFEETTTFTITLVIYKGAVCNNVKFYPMISVEGGEFEPYTESVETLSNPITLNGLNGVQDYIDAKRGVLVQKFKEVTLNGSEDWKASAVANRYYINNFYCKHIGELLCTQAKGIAGDTKNVNECFLTNASNGQFIINTSFTTLAEWKSHLASKPMTVVYELAEPIETPLPEADVEALKNIRTFKGVTHFTTDSEVKPDLEVEYVIDTKMYIDAKIKELS